MRTQIVIKAILFLLFAAGAYCIYGMCRTMMEAIGLHLGNTLFASLITLLVLAPLLFGYSFALGFQKVKIHWAKTLALILVAWFLATAMSEFQILADERNFVQESQHANATGADNYLRNRAWPNGASQLVWQRDKGIHATD